MELLLTIAVIYGITFGIKDSKILEWPRNWLASRNEFFLQLFGCPYCVGFHSGWLSFLILWPQPYTTDIISFIQGLVLYAFAGTSISGILDAIAIRLENKEEKEDEEKEDEES